MAVFILTNLVRNGRTRTAIQKLHRCLNSSQVQILPDKTHVLLCKHFQICLQPAVVFSCHKHSYDTDPIHQRCFSNKTSVQIIDNYRVKFTEEENEYFHTYLQQSTTFRKYMLYALDGETDYLSAGSCSELLESVQSGTFDKSIESVLQCLQYLSHTSPLRQDQLFHNDSFTFLMLLLAKNLNTLNDEMFWKSVRIVTTFNFRNCITTNTRELRLKLAQAFDTEFCKRSTSWQMENYFQAGDFYYHFRCSSLRWVRFLPNFFSYIRDHLSHLSSSEVALTMFQVNLYRRTSSAILSGLVQSVHKHINNFTAEEMGIICLGFHKSEQAVPNIPMFRDFIHAIKGMVTSMDDPCLSAVMKFIQRSTHKRMARGVPTVIQSVVDLQPLLAPRIHTAGFSTAIHIISVYDNLHNTSEDLLSRLCQKVLAQDIQQCRIKDLANVSRILGNVALEVPGVSDVFKKVVLELQAKSRVEERKQFLDSVVKCLLGMSMRGVYPHLLIDQVLNKEGQKFFSATKQSFWRDLYHLSESVRIEDPSYQGPLLATPGHVPRSKGRSGTAAGSPTLREAMMQEMVASYAQILGGAEFVSMGLLLRHYQTPDIEIRIHPTGQPTSASKWTTTESAEKIEPGSNLNPLASQLLHLAARKPIKRIAVVLHGINAYYTVRQADGSVDSCLAGLHAAKVRQLRKLGYTVVEIPHFDLKNVENKEEYLKLKTFGTLLDDQH